VIVELQTAATTRRVELIPGEAGWTVHVDGRSLQATLVRAGERWSLLIADGAALPRSYEIALDDRGPGDLVVYVEGQPTAVTPIDPRARARHGRARAGSDGEYDGPGHVKAPMPGRIVKLLVAPGDAVTAQQGVIVVEAMKMENELRAPKAGTVTAIHVAEGATVDANATLITID
jgi:biotin carboxyl carrier protein